VETELRFSNYAVNNPVDTKLFFTEPPAGYSPETLTDDVEPPYVGEAVALTGMAPLAGGAPADLRSAFGAKPLIVAVVAPDCAPSHDVLGSLASIGKEVERKGGALAAIWTGRPKSAPRGLAHYVDPSGKAMERLRAPGTPLVLMIHASGRVTQVWFGYDPANRGDFEKEVLEAVSKTASIK
jgi:hypothetical protein